MKNIQSRWGIAQIAICAGIVCIAGGFVCNLISTVYAQPGCSNNAENFALCQSGPWPTCPSRSVDCSSEQEWDVESGDFRCETPSPGTACITSASSAVCYTVYMCRKGLGSDNCMIDRTGPSYPYRAALMTSTDCPS